jgi:hypothetical protein
MARENRRLNVSDRQVAVALVLVVAILFVGLIANETGAVFTKTVTNPGNVVAALRVDPPAAHAAPVSAPAGAVNLSWSATPTSPGAGHTLDYLVLRGPAGGPHAQVGATASLALTDTPPADGIYAYVIQARVSGGGAFTSVNSPERTGISDRTAPSTTAGAPSASDVKTFRIPVSYSDGGTGVTWISLYAKDPAAGSFSLVSTNSFASSASGTSTFTYTALAGTGTYGFYAIGSDSAGNVAATPGSAQSATLFDPTLELKRTTNNDGTNPDLLPGYTPSGADTTCSLASGRTCTFATATYTSGQAFAAGTSTASLYLQNGMATIALRSKSSAATSGGGPTTITIATPSGTASGDVLIAGISFEAGTDENSITVPGGWTLVRQVNNSNNEGLAVYRMVAGGSEPASYSWTFGQSRSLSGGILAFTGVDNTTPIDVESGQATAEGTTHATPSITTTQANAVLVTHFAMPQNASWTPPTGMNEEYDVPEIDRGNSLEGDTVTQAAPGATGAKTATANTTAVGVTHILALRPAQLSCTLTVQVLQNTTSLGSSTVAVTGPTAALQTVGVTTSAATFATGDRLYLKVTAPASAGCVGALRYDGASSVSKLVHPQ